MTLDPTRPHLGMDLTVCLLQRVSVCFRIVPTIRQHVLPLPARDVVVVIASWHDIPYPGTDGTDSR